MPSNLANSWQKHTSRNLQQTHIYISFYMVVLYLVKPSNNFFTAYSKLTASNMKSPHKSPTDVGLCLKLVCESHAIAQMCPNAVWAVTCVFFSTCRQPLSLFIADDRFRLIIQFSVAWSVCLSSVTLVPPA